MIAHLPARVKNQLAVNKRDCQGHMPFGAFFPRCRMMIQVARAAVVLHGRRFAQWGAFLAIQRTQNGHFDLTALSRCGMIFSQLNR